MRFITNILLITPILTLWASVKYGQDGNIKIWVDPGKCLNVATFVEEVDMPVNVMLQFFKEVDCQIQAHVVAWGKAKRERPFYFQSVRAYNSTESYGGITGKEGDIYDTRTD
ncbi:hypothetical protein CONCODRAFT_12195 [Conidiobolus coronatus NRRL 28638]|uniref:Uncharacterized protein n=1 Tax=Conidiobolus coronatus (strain ATCC 28846 / CBS 209.66 / NRRL 28638) TaxID=796925 RepID=A0A137NTJ9_CONC2|nr:hypothetical protein CONCODRAFT_12195 [Conidiobolus coronatus NRRL 28638]|eukprot:KXN66046.1 hypothetical protein CONCODRAFT_12195 [Conidiobolus coronatus NRRL 28638]